MLRKLLTVDKIDVKFAGTTGEFEGYASVFNGVDSYGDTIVPGAYKKTLKNRQRPVRMRWNHWGPVIGKWMNIEEDEKGLKVSGQLTPGHSVASDVAASMKHGAVDGLSIGYYIVTDGMKDGVRQLKEIELIEISVVEEPADRSALITDVKSAFEAADSMKQIESLLRDVGGFSQLEAKTLVSRVKSLVHRDDVSTENETKQLADIILNRRLFT